MANKPLLIFPKPTKVDERTPLSPGFGATRTPSHQRQIERIDERLNLLFDALESKRTFLQQNIVGATPEMVLVLEFIGSITNFFSAVKKVPELQFLAEFEASYQSDDDFHSVDRNNERQEGDLPGQLFLVMTNQGALNQLLRLWRHFKNDSWERTPTGRIANGLARFRDVFATLKDIRPYGIQDRLRDTGFSDYISKLIEFGNPVARFEVELFYRTNSNDQISSSSQLRRLLELNNGTIIVGSEVILNEIQYHAVIAEAPIGVFNNLTEQSNIAFLQCEQVMYFRPVGQVIVGTTLDNELPEIEEKENQKSELPPIIALLDGYPFSNHTSIRNKIIIDDPDNFLDHYQATEMLHGTAMASLIINGDLDGIQNTQLNRPIYIRPIMHPDSVTGGTRHELIPPDRLPIDLIHQAVKRIFEGDNGEEPVAPNIKIINLSIGDPVRPFHLNISPWAKLLDWLSHKYNVLFVISSGNWTEDIILNISQVDFMALSDERKRSLIFESIKSSNLQARKVLTPSEAINGIAVGASYYDETTNVGSPVNIPLFDSSSFIAPYSRIGLGYHRAIKPDILNSGGRLAYRIDIIRSMGDSTVLRISPNSFARTGPGQRVASPGNIGSQTTTAYTSGTSNATALTSRLAAQLHEVLESINAELSTDLQINLNYFSVLLKALLVHGASWDGAEETIYKLLSTDPQIDPRVIKDHVCSYLGYGATNANKILYCTDERVTLLGFGEIRKETGHLYSFPLPNLLHENAYKKRMAVTLAWLSPLNFNTARYRQAALYLNNLSYDRERRPDEPFHFNHTNAGIRISRRGTVQHNILEDAEVGYYIDGGNLNIKVNCKEDAGGLGQQLVKYGLAVTLEVKEQIPISIYQEIEQRIQAQTRVRV